MIKLSEIENLALTLQIPASEAEKMVKLLDKVRFWNNCFISSSWQVGELRELLQIQVKSSHQGPPEVPSTNSGDIIFVKHPYQPFSHLRFAVTEDRSKDDSPSSWVLVRYFALSDVSAYSARLMHRCLRAMSVFKVDEIEINASKRLLTVVLGQQFVPFPSPNFLPSYLFDSSCTASIFSHWQNAASISCWWCVVEKSCMWWMETWARFWVVEMGLMLKITIFSSFKKLSATWDIYEKASAARATQNVDAHSRGSFKATLKHSNHDYNLKNFRLCWTNAAHGVAFPSCHLDDVHETFLWQAT